MNEPKDSAPALIADVFDLSGRKVIVFTYPPDNAPIIRIGDRITVRSRHGVTAVAEIIGIELPNYRDPADYTRGQGGLWIRWDGSGITDPDLKGSTFTKAVPS